MLLRSLVIFFSICFLLQCFSPPDTPVTAEWLMSMNDCFKSNSPYNSADEKESAAENADSSRIENTISLMMEYHNPRNFASEFRSLGQWFSSRPLQKTLRTLRFKVCLATKENLRPQRPRWAAEIAKKF